MCTESCVDSHGQSLFGTCPILCGTLTCYKKLILSSRIVLVYRYPQGDSTSDQPSECFQPSRHYLISLWDVPAKWCFIRNQCQITCSSSVTQTMWGHRSHCQASVEAWVSSLFHLLAVVSSGRRERTGCLFVLAQRQVGEHTQCSGPCARAGLWRYQCGIPQPEQCSFQPVRALQGYGSLRIPSLFSLAVSQGCTFP